MGIFRHNKESTGAQTAYSSGSVRHRLRQLLGKKDTQSRSSNHVRETCSQDGSVRSVLGSRPHSAFGESTTVQSLWERAYDALRKDNPQLVEEYEKLISNDGQMSIVPSNDGTDGQSRQAQLGTVIAAGLQRAEENKTKYTIAGHEFVLTDRIAQAADLVLWAKDLIGEAVKLSPEASIAWAGVCIVLPLLTNPKVAEEANRDGFTYVTTRMRYYTELEPLLQRLGRNPEVSRALIVEANNHIVELYQHILDFQIRSVLRFYQSCLRRYVSGLFLTKDWNQMRLDIEKLEDTVNRNLSQINQLTSRQELESLNDIATKTLENMQQFLLVSEEQLRVAGAQLNVAKRGLEIQEEATKLNLTEKQEKCLQLFHLTGGEKGTNYEWYKDRVEDRVEGTCEWFLNHEDFQRWLVNESGLLVVSADPGCGKSVLAKYLIDHGLPRSVTICYFFFKDQDQNTVRQTLCALLHQLLSQKPFLIKHAMEQFAKDGEGLINLTTSLWTVLGNALQDPQAGPVIMVLDAMDECAESEFENLIKNVENQFRNNQSSCGKLKYLLTSRPYKQIMSRFPRLLETFPYVCIPGEEESESISQEVNRVIKYRVEKLAKHDGLSDQVKDHLAERLLSIRHRTYLWIYLVFDYLEKEDFKKTRKGFDSAMETLPKNIYQAYEQILNRSKDHPMVQKALSIILAASRPLTILEMNVAVNIDDTSKSIDDLDLEEEEDFKSRLRSWCGLFVSIYHGKIYFLHQTAREFLLEPSSPSTVLRGVNWQHSITSRAAHRVLADVCVTYLDFLNSDSIPPGRSHRTNQDLQRYTFLDYSAKFWGDHFRMACVSNDANIIPFALRICDPSLSSFSTWFNAYWKDNMGIDVTDVTNTLVWSYFGHEVLVRLQLEKEPDLAVRQGNYYPTPLAYAVKKGHDAVVKLWLEKGANVEPGANMFGQSLLAAAVEKGEEKIIKLLLEYGANMESKSDIYGQSPLAAAVEKGEEKIIKLFLEYGANIESKSDIYGRSPLAIAVEQGDEKIIKLLLEYGANIESKNLGGQSLLAAAVKKGKENIIKLLLEYGADIESKSNRYGQSPLLAAVKKGKEKIIKLLLEYGANIESKSDMFGQSPLAAAVEKGKEKTVKLLLEYGANIESKSDIYGQSPLAAAAKQGYKKTVKLLLEYGANIESKDLDGETPLALASIWGREAVVELLLENGANIESKDLEGRTPLVWAFEERREAVVKLLLRNGANIESKDL
ncbi:ankyrin [Xylaria palmicola]|nr:ankyrin [Xylaria palmicola]